MAGVRTLGSASRLLTRAMFAQRQGGGHQGPSAVVGTMPGRGMAAEAEAGAAEEQPAARKERLAELASRRAQLREAVAEAVAGSGGGRGRGGGDAAPPGAKVEEEAGTSSSQSGRFMDKLALEVHAGRGGSGVASFLGKLRIPAGGNGGPGGDVVVRACGQSRTLAHIRQLQRARNGGHGGSNNKTGSPAPHT